MFLDTLTQLLEEKQITKSELSRRAGIPYTTIDGWYKKSTEGIHLKTLLTLTEFFDVTMDFLCKGKSEKYTLEETRLLGRFRGLDTHGKAVLLFISEEEYRRIMENKKKAAAAAAAAAANASGDTETDVEEYLFVEEDDPRKIPLYLTAAAAGLAAPIEGEDYEMITVASDAPYNAQFAVRISGDSMEPDIQDGQIVYCVKDGVSLRDGDIGVFCVDGAYYCKQYRSDGENMYLVSLNRKRSDSDITIWGSGNRRATFLGKVLG